MKYVAVVILLLLSVSLVCAQGSKRTTTPNPGTKYTFDTTLIFTLHKKLPKMYLRYRHYFDSENHEYHYRVDLSRTKTRKPFQVIKSESFADRGPLDYDYENNLGIRNMFVDINFDGYIDLRFKKMEGGCQYSVNQSYDFFIFNVTKFKFEFNQEVSDVGNATPIKDKTVYGYWRNGFSATDGTVDQYQWINGHLILIRSYNYTILSKNRDPYTDKNTLYLKQSQIYEDGKLIRSLHKRVRLKDIPKEHLRYW